MPDLIKVATPMCGDEEIEAVAEVLYSGNYVSGAKVKEFESEFADYIGTEHAVAVDSGTDAIRLTLLGMGIGPGDEVMVPALTFFATASAVLMVGATPVFADIDPETYNLDPKDALKKLTERTTAIIPVHYFGHPVDVSHFTDIGEDYEITIIGDAAQAHGAEYKGKRVGSFFEAEAWSFYATKNITTSTEGGMVTTDNGDLAEVLRILRNHGMTDGNTHSLLGGNNRMSEIGAAVGLVQLRYLDRFNEARAANSMYLRERLEGVPWLKVPPIKDYCSRHSFFWCPIEADELKLGMTTLQIRKRLYDAGVETRHRYTAPLYRQPVLEQYRRLHDYSKDWCPVAERVCGKLLGLPNHPKLEQSDLDRIVEVVKSI